MMTLPGAGKIGLWVPSPEANSKSLALQLSTKTFWISCCVLLNVVLQKVLLLDFFAFIQIGGNGGTELSSGGLFIFEGLAWGGMIPRAEGLWGTQSGR
jgi:hypothetical protein